MNRWHFSRGEIVGLLFLLAVLPLYVAGLYFALRDDSTARVVFNGGMIGLIAYGLVALFDCHETW